MSWVARSVPAAREATPETEVPREAVKLSEAGTVHERSLLREAAPAREASRLREAAQDQAVRQSALRGPFPATQRRSAFVDLLLNRRPAGQVADAPVHPLLRATRTPVRLDVLAPAHGEARVTVPRLRHTGRMRVTGSHAVVIGNHNKVHTDYRYRVRQVEVERRDVDALRHAMRDFLRGRDLRKPVTKAEFDRFRACVRGRLEWPPATPPARRISRSIRTPAGYEIAGCEGVVHGHHNRIRTREDLVVRKCAVRLGRLAHRDDRFARDLFDRVRAGEDPTKRLGEAVDRGLRRTGAPERVDALGGLGRVSAERGRAAVVDNAGAVVIGRGNRTTSRVDRADTGRVRVDSGRAGPWDGPPGSLGRTPEKKDGYEARHRAEQRREMRRG